MQNVRQALSGFSAGMHAQRAFPGARFAVESASLSASGIKPSRVKINTRYRVFS